ncbi:hypothetical protein M0804_002395 [Polistes exclamans]|nr:hypothetical protein M0804_002395 [Polistes exclamans]
MSKVTIRQSDNSMVVSSRKEKLQCSLTFPFESFPTIGKRVDKNIDDDNDDDDDDNDDNDDNNDNDDNDDNDDN